MMSSLLDVTLSGLVAFGTPSFSIFINSWLLFLVLRSIMMVLAALLQMPWFETEVGLSNLVPPPYVSDCGSCHSSWSSWFFGVALGVPCILSPSLGKMSLSDPTVLTSSLCYLLFWPHCIGLRVILILGKFGISYFELLLMFEILCWS